MRSIHQWSRHAREAGLSMAQTHLLMRLHHHGACGVREVAEDLGVSAAAASQLAEWLVLAALVERAEDPHDRRARILTLSARGREVLHAGLEERYRWVDDLAAALTPEQRGAALVAFPSLIEAEERLPGCAADTAPGAHRNCGAGSGAERSR